MRVRFLVAVLLISAGGVSTAATSYRVDSANSSLEFTATQTGAPIQGQFRRFRAAIQFAEADLAGSRFEVTIETKSVDSGEDDRDEALRSADLLAVEKFPAARFVTTGFTRVADGKYEAAGKLTLRGVTRDINLPFTFEERTGAKGREAWLKGGISLNRLDYGVGQGDWKDTSWVADEVKVSFSLRLEPQKD